LEGIRCYFNTVFASIGGHGAHSVSIVVDKLSVSVIQENQVIILVDSEKGDVGHPHSGSNVYDHFCDAFPRTVSVAITI
jgi:hypothetical protein